MPLSPRTPVELTDLSEPLLRRSHGRLASDEAQAVGRIAEHLDATRRERAPIGELVRECSLTPQVLAALIRSGVLVVLEVNPDGGCERCGARSLTPLCGGCRSFLGGHGAEAPSKSAPAAATALAPQTPTARRGMLSSRRSR